mmetsp:Transcript_18123/g.24248  ORF Transcript_18123/g.24248 Transcript_18123/m.24248 type:complete len:83 (-) Transcript_18123:191-439(-)
MFDAYVIESIRLLKYADMAFEMAMRNEWTLAGIFASNFLGNFTKFFWLFATADDTPREDVPTGESVDSDSNSGNGSKDDQTA